MQDQSVPTGPGHGLRLYNQLQTIPFEFRNRKKNPFGPIYVLYLLLTSFHFISLFFHVVLFLCILSRCISFRLNCVLFPFRFTVFHFISFQLRFVSMYFVLIAFCFAVFRFVSTSFCTLIQPNDDFYFLLAVFPQLYSHMIAQRKKVIGGAVRPKSE